MCVAGEGPQTRDCIKLSSNSSIHSGDWLGGCAGCLAGGDVCSDGSREEFRMVEALEWLAGRLHLFLGGVSRSWVRRGSGAPLLNDGQGNRSSGTPIRRVCCEVFLVYLYTAIPLPTPSLPPLPSLLSSTAALPRPPFLSLSLWPHMLPASPLRLPLKSLFFFSYSRKL